jgi:two-component system cell cycle response regulator DivK
VLTFKGYQVIETERGEDGVRLAKERLPKLVLMDIHLPSIDGIEALRQIRADEARAPSRSWP